MRCATPSPADETPQQRRDLLMRGCSPGRRHRFDRAALELLDGTGLIDHLLVQEHTTVELLSTSSGPWWYTTLEWDALGQDATLADLTGVEGRLLRLAARIGVGATVDSDDAVHELSPAHVGVVTAALDRAAGHGGQIDIPLSPSRADRPLRQWPARQPRRQPAERSSR